MADRVEPPLARLLADARRHAAGLPPAWLDDVVPAAADAALRARSLTPGELARVQDVGAQAARAGVELTTLLDLQLHAARLAWDALDDLADAAGVPRPDRVQAGAAALQAAHDALSAVADGFAAARRLLARQEDAVRRELVDDLLDGRGDFGVLAERAEHVGVHLAAVHVVAVAQRDVPVTDASAVLARVEARLGSAFPRRGVLVTTRDGLLVCVLADSGQRDGAGQGGTGQALAGVLRELPDVRDRTGGPSSAWRVGVGRARAGPGGVARSFRDAVEALELAHRLGLPDPVALADQLLVYRVLLRDQAAMADLVTAVLSPLAAARGGPAVLLDTLNAYFAAGCVTTEAARRLHLSVRAVAYRLDRVRELTGHDATDVRDRLPLEVAVVGARLLGWPDRRLPVG